MKPLDVIYADLDDMLFEDRERRYGAYFLRKTYRYRLFAAVALVAVFFMAASVGPHVMRILGQNTGNIETSKPMVVKVSMSELPPPPPVSDEQKPPPPPPPKAPPPKVRTVAFKIPEPTSEEDMPQEEEEATIANVDELKEAPNIGLEDQEGAETGFFDGEIEVEEDVPEVLSVVEEEVPDVNAFIFVEEEPKPINLDEVKSMIGYPTFARDAGIEGRVIIRVLVDEMGQYMKHKVINQVHPALTEACEKQIVKLRFTPAIQGGTPIKFWINIPFNFQLIQ